MNVLNFGSCCIDNVYAVPHFARPGETLPCSSYAVHPGGKGLNQSLALARGGANVRHAGKVGTDGRFLKALLDSAGVDTSLLEEADGPTAHANIQVTPEGENSIVQFAGANRTIGPADVEAVFGQVTPGDLLLLQNEISCLPLIMQRAADAGLFVAFNAAPMTAAVQAYPLHQVSMFIVNELEGQALTGESAPEQILDVMREGYPAAAVILTLGEAGAWYADAHRRIHQASRKVVAVDTTGAGDTFTGFFLAAWVTGAEPAECLARGCAAAAICVTRPGAASSIPEASEVV